MTWWHLLVELFALGMTIVVGVIAFLVGRSNSVEAAASLEVIGRMPPEKPKD